MSWKISVDDKCPSIESLVYSVVDLQHEPIVSIRRRDSLGDVDVDCHGIGTGLDVDVSLNRTERVVVSHDVLNGCARNGRPRDRLNWGCRGPLWLREPNIGR